MARKGMVIYYSECSNMWLRLNNTAEKQQLPLTQHQKKQFNGLFLGIFY